MEQKNKINFLINFFYLFTVGIIIYICARFLIGYLLPFVIGSFIAWWVQKPSVIISEKVKIKRGMVAAVLSLVIFIIAAAIVIFAFYKLILGAKDIFDRLPQITEYSTNFFENLRKRFGGVLFEIPPEMSKTLNGIRDNILENAVSKVTGIFSAFIGNIAQKIPSFIFSLIVTLVATCYIAKDFEKLVKFGRELCGESLYEKICDIKVIFTSSVLKLFKGYAVLTAITFLELLIGLYALGFKHSLILAGVISIIDLLPVFGTGTVLLPWGLTLVVLGDVKGVLILVLYLIITIVRNFLEPKIIGAQIGINPLFTLLVMFAGLRVMGFFGLIIFPIVFIVTFKYYKHQLDIERTEK